MRVGRQGFHSTAEASLLGRSGPQPAPFIARIDADEDRFYERDRCRYHIPPVSCPEQIENLDRPTCLSEESSDQGRSTRHMVADSRRTLGSISARLFGDGLQAR